ncbi:unnamed protein product [Ostreobium quekettii]|uniref:BACK domain-containing protein n=1 Tax=Ostreobium quekettii TaxID=121088 RepID=A0A8S1J7S3_9CHLO|nr:unnamed protein product [Ostreobium quekettii]|eukprot:evm.model.scf_1245.1 EVM.evm.TU.scf_1245.1   scf_1245:17099-20273(+)
MHDLMCSSVWNATNSKEQQLIARLWVPGEGDDTLGIFGGLGVALLEPWRSIWRETSMSAGYQYCDALVRVKLVESPAASPPASAPRHSDGHAIRRNDCPTPPDSKKRKRCTEDHASIAAGHRQSGSRDSGSGSVDAAEKRESAPDRVEYDASAFCLASASPYFRSALDRWCDRAGGRSVVEVEAAASELPALKVLLGFVHGRDLPSEVDPEDLLSLLVLADRYIIDRLVPFVCKRLVRMGLGWRGAARVLGLFEAPRGCLAPATRYLMEAADRALIEEFSDLERAWMCPEDRERFLGLPLAAVLSLLSSDGLRVGAEETAFWAVTEWLARHFPGQAGSAPPGNEAYLRAATQLGNCVRFPLIAAPYLHGIVAGAAWVRDADPAGAWVEDALEFDALSGREREAIRGQTWRRDRRFRARAPSPRPEVFVSWAASPEEFREGALSGSGATSPEVWYKGYVWTLQCEVADKASPGGGVMMGLYVDPPGVASTSLRVGWQGEMLQVPPEAGVRRVTFRTATRSGLHNEVAVDSHDWTLGEGYYVPDFFRAPLEAVVAPDSRFVVDGKIRMSVKISPEADRSSMQSLRRRFLNRPYMDMANQ